MDTSSKEVEALERVKSIKATSTKEEQQPFKIEIMECASNLELLIAKYWGKYSSKYPKKVKNFLNETRTYAINLTNTLKQDRIFEEEGHDLGKIMMKRPPFVPHIDTLIDKYWGKDWFKKPKKIKDFTLDASLFENDLIDESL